MLRRALIVLIGSGALGAAFVAGALVHKYRAAIRARLRSVQGSPIIQTSLYNLNVHLLAIPGGEGRDGGIDVLGDGLLLVNRKGRSWFVTDRRELRPLAVQAPINVTDFESDPYNTTTTDQNRFSVKDILVQPIASRVRILVSHMYWHRDRRCNTLRVSALETTMDSVTAGKTGTGTWRTVFESSPCRELNVSADGRTHHVTLGAGGRLAALSDRQLLVGVGEFSAEYQAPPTSTSSAIDSYGKTLSIDMGTGAVTEFTRGHRNQQGMTVAPDGRIWQTEHGSRGGDELNLLTPGKNYGAPHVTYGTQYEMMVWPLSKTQGRHEGYEKPVHAWVPSIATSQLVVLSGKSFPWWTGDLLVSTLASESLYRVRVEEGRVIFVEPFFVGHRIRDLVETASGSIVLKTDDDFLIYIDNLESTPAANLDPATRGEIVAGQCRSCHSFQEGAPGGIGPNLWNVVGRRVASSPGYTYSDALKKLSGSWTPERLRLFIANPKSFAPGNRMEIATTYTDQQLNDLIAYLRTQR